MEVITSDREPLKSPVEQLKGVGEAKAKELFKLSINTVEDLLFYFPYRYEDRRLRDLADAEHEETITVEGAVHSAASVKFYGRKKSRLSCKVQVDRYLITAVLFNQHFAKKHFKPGQKMRLTGKLDKNRLQLTVHEYKLIQNTEETSSQPGEKDELLPVYTVSGKISVTYIRKLVEQALADYVRYIPETIPPELCRRYKLMDRVEAVQTMHKPMDYEQGKQARRRIVYEEFLMFQLKMLALKKIRRETVPGTPQPIDETDVRRFVHKLPFALTDAQRKVLDDILTDLRSERAMNRLLQGDVGSGKTVVAAAALYASIKAGYQAAFMVPTEILAEQHDQSLRQFFDGENIHVELLTGSVTTRRRKDILAGLQMGTVDLVIGTHALIQDDVFFKQLGLMITDEQHRFGVNQRKKLRQKGKAPDVLFMTATPIPRTLSITAFGDLDISIIDELPKGRKPIKTYWAKHDMLDRVFDFTDKEIKQGRQAYVICPLIEESEKMDYENAVDFQATLTERFPQYNVGLMHGRMPAAEKEQIMHRFAANDIHILVSTTVVEVGVDVPNASIMIIQDAERFGLSQLHQLRGRVGRGSVQSYCILIADPKTGIGQERMRIMQSTNDGFKIAEHDLKLRGPGELFGTKQSGLPEFRVADMVHDYRALAIAREDARRLVESEAFWQEDRFRLLRAFLDEENIFEQGKLD